ncbi:MAG: SDR family NAD(P)-dependent oxidoreductase [Microbacteriaceae bacterium]|nr:SDR family NAD(P)-dependent oxidoreductase [Microbacteriaceae bacterium]
MGVALVTGGTSGIGAAFARLLAARGYDLVLVARSAERLEVMATELRATGRTVELLPADLADREAVARVAERLTDPGHPIDLLVNNAGFGMHASSLDPDVSEFDRAFEVMGRAVFVLSGAAARGMVERGSGSIVNVSSTAGFLTMGAYSSIKAWVTSYTEGLAVELRGTGVSVTALCPGWVRTEFHERAGIRASSIPNFMWLDAEQMVSAALRDVDRGKVISIPTLRYRALISLAGLAPKSAIRSFSGVISSSRRKPIAR